MIFIIMESLYIYQAHLTDLNLKWEKERAGSKLKFAYRGYHGIPAIPLKEPYVPECMKWKKHEIVGLVSWGPLRVWAAP